jgi:hypothetical protein
MGLSAVVYKSVAAVEAALGFGPYSVDPDTGEVSLVDGSGRSLSIDSEFAERRYFGNVSQIAYLRQEIAAHIGEKSIICGLILYSGSHSGDTISTEKITELENELEELRNKNLSIDADKFCSDLEMLTSASKIQKNPIVFV